MKYIAYSIIGLLLLGSCAKKQDPFLIEKDQIGKLYKEATIAKLDSIYAQDSIVKRIGEGDYVQASDDQYLIYDKAGKLMLTLMPTQQHDNDEKIKTITIHDERFKTAKGIHLNSTFKDINANYTIKSIYNTFKTIIISVDADEYFTIDKKELPEDLRYDINLNIEAVQIPETAKIKYMQVHWDHTKKEASDGKE